MVVTGFAVTKVDNLRVRVRVSVAAHCRVRKVWNDAQYDIPVANLVRKAVKIGLLSAKQVHASAMACRFIPWKHSGNLAARAFTLGELVMVVVVVLFSYESAKFQIDRNQRDRPRCRDECCYCVLLRCPSSCDDGGKSTGGGCVFEFVQGSGKWYEPSDNARKCTAPRPSRNSSKQSSSSWHKPEIGATESLVGNTSMPPR